jgi:hypothetical protein
MGTGYGLREGWPWLVVALGIGGLFRNMRSLAAEITTILGIFILGSRYYSHPPFDPFHHQDILSASPVDRHRPPLALEI